MFKPTLKYAIVCGIFLSFLFFVSIWFGVNPLLVKQGLLFDIVIFVLFIAAADREFKRYHNDGYLHFWQGMTIGFITYGIATAVFLMVVLSFFLVNPDYLAVYKADLLNEAIKEQDKLIEQVGEDGYEQVKQGINGLTIGQILFSSTVPPSAMLKKIFAGFFVTPLISLILRKKPD